jgi:integrase
MLGGGYPIALRISHLNNPSVYIRIQGLKVMDPSEWNTELSRFNKKRRNYKKLNKILSEIEEKADNILSSLLAQNDFSYHKFKDLYIGKVVCDRVIEWFDKKIEELNSLKKYGNADAYTASRNAILEYTGNSRLIFSNIDYGFLTSFEHHLRLKGNSGNTISYKLRPLRALHYKYCNTANLSLPMSYKRFNIGRLSEATSKRALNKYELDRFIEYNPVNKGERMAKDIFMFSLLTRGTNIADIAFLNSTNIIGDKIIYKRSKTGTIFTITITHEINSIIDRYKGAHYLFPIIQANHKNEKYSIRLFTKYVNKHLQKIADKLKIVKITTYYARYTYSAMARELGISIELISQALGHGDLKTTEIYLSSFSNDMLDDITNKIISNLKS